MINTVSSQTSEVPRYRATRDIQPAQKARFRSEPPFAHAFDSDVWQYGSELVKAGQMIETKDWPHPSFRPMNHAAERVLDFFNTRMKSRLPRAPFSGDRLRLDDGLTGTAIVDVVPPQLKPMDLRPVS